MKTPWLVRFVPRPSAQLRLFCFPHAGGGGAIYRPWALAAPADIEVIAVVLPGREGRLSELPLQRMADVLAALGPAIAHRQSTAGSLPRSFEGPISAFGGDTDARVPRHELDAWQSHTSQRLVVRQFPGGHFYLNDAQTRSALIAAVVTDLRADLTGPARR